MAAICYLWLLYAICYLWLLYAIKSILDNQPGTHDESPGTPIHFWRHLSLIGNMLHLSGHPPTTKFPIPRTPVHSWKYLSFMWDRRYCSNIHWRNPHDAHNLPSGWGKAEVQGGRKLADSWLWVCELAGEFTLTFLFYHIKHTQDIPVTFA